MYRKSVICSIAALEPYCLSKAFGRRLLTIIVNEIHFDFQGTMEYKKGLSAECCDA